MSRHPYTYAADFMREACQDGEEIAGGIRACPLSRSDASVIRQRIAGVLGMDDAVLAEKLSLAYQEKHLIATLTPEPRE